MSRKLRITSFSSRRVTAGKQSEATWSALVRRLTSSKQTDETFVDYKHSAEKNSIKDVGGFVGGHFSPNVRRAPNLQFRSVLALDADHLAPEQVDPLLAAYSGYAFVWHTSHSHSPEAPRLRLVFPLSRDVRPEEYEPLARSVAAMADMEVFDDTCYEPARLMYWPSHSVDGEHLCGESEGEWLDPDFIFDLTYSDPKDFGQWPRSKREQKEGRISGTLRKVTPAWDKPGLIGEFNRTFEVPVVIEEFDLPYVPSGMGEGRYSYGPGTSVDGAIYYPGDGHLHSWHESDPARGTACSWDLVRLHRFGNLDDGLDPSTPIGERPSQKAMMDFVQRNEAIARAMHASDFDIEPGSIKDAVTDEDAAVSAGAGHTFASLLEIAKTDPPENADERLEFYLNAIGAGFSGLHINTLLDTLQSHKPPGGRRRLEQDLAAARKEYERRKSEEGAGDIELALIQRTLDRYFAGGDYIRRMGQRYWTYKHGVWRRHENDEAINGLLSKSVIELRSNNKKEYRRLQEAVESKDTSTVAGKLSGLMANLLASGDADEENALSNKNKKPPVMNCLNGELWFDEDGTFELRPHRAENMFTSQLNAIYDPGAACPEWDRLCEIMFQDSIFPDELKRHLEEICGYILQMSRDLKSIFVFYGATNAGKSSVVSVVTSMLGEAVSSRDLTDIAKDSHGEAALMGKLLAVDDDKSKHGAIDDGLLKKISEAKILTANPKNAGTFQFMCLAVPLIVSNSLPRIGASDPAILDRLKIVGFPHSMTEEERCHKRAAAMEQETSGILNRFVEGYARLKKRGYFLEPIESQELRVRWQDDADSVARWFHECIERTGDPKDLVRHGPLYRLYRNWMENEGQGRFTKGKQHFLEGLRDLAGDDIRTLDGYKVLRGYRLIEDPFGEDDD